LKYVAGERCDFIDCYSFRYLEPMKWLENKNDVAMFWGFDDSAGL